MTRQLKIAVVYATDFRRRSPGGIQSFIREVGRLRPTQWSIRYVGVGEVPGSLPSPKDEFVSVLTKPDPGRRLNGQFVRALRSNESLFTDVDMVIVHRAEHVLGLPRAVRPVLVLHGGATFAWRSGRRLFGAAYPALEMYAMTRACGVQSVVPGAHVLSRFRAIVPTSTSFDPNLWWVKEAPPLQRRLLVAARLVPEKRIELAIEVAARLGWPMTIMGDGPERERLELHSKSCCVDASFTGFIPPNRLRSTYAAQPGVFVMTSRFEGFPAAAVEAAASGLGLVGLEAPGVSDAFRRLGGITVSGAESMAHAAADLVAGQRDRPPRETVWAYRSSEVARQFWVWAAAAASGRRTSELPRGGSSASPSALGESHNRIH